MIETTTEIRGGTRGRRRLRSSSSALAIAATLLATPYHVYQISL
jgi:hypothetical protein